MVADDDMPHSDITQFTANNEEINFPTITKRVFLTPPSKVKSNG